jgi:hypothetical protein
MLGLICTVVAILAVHLILTNVNAVNKLHWLVGLVAFDDPNTH